MCRGLEARDVKSIQAYIQRSPIPTQGDTKHAIATRLYDDLVYAPHNGMTGNDVFYTSVHAISTSNA